MSKKLYAPSTVKSIKDSHDFKFSKSLGQNFLVDKNIVDHIVDGAGIGPDDLAIEIGPGMGVITSEAAQRAAKVVAVEIDKTLIPILKETLAEHDNVDVINQDILKTDVNEIIETYGEGRTAKNIKIIGNLPYYITTPIIMKILEDGVPASSITIMMQREVAERINAKPGTKDYGALSVAVQYYCDTQIVANVPKEAFMPQPKVGSTVLRLDIREDRLVELKEKDVFFQVVKAGFGQRRKTLSNSLMGVSGITKEIVPSAVRKCGTAPVP
ncbi:MAG: 16S rRNA (adenine(1518)-N(6)/adenine(1519)-N(6))-dimethyltransferase RsmA [Firmicutes bacterium]|nr:16S rRNA (adenine(1518)-N(6)/adenine(1519)-N(6))-dimethyltransferase RsmA [Bacillota bacterium]